jgi:hypothetical protein
VEAAAIVTAFYADVKRKHGGGFASPEDFAKNRASGTDRYPPEFQIGGNAYQSLPFFEYFKSR